MPRGLIRAIMSVLLLTLMLAGCDSNRDNTDVINRWPNDQVNSEATDLQLALLNHVSYRADILKALEGQSIEGHDELIDDKYKRNILSGDTLVNQLKGYTLVDFDDGNITGFKAAAYTKGNSLVIVYCGTDGLADIDAIVDFSSFLFDWSAQDGQVKAFIKDNINKYKHYDLYVTGYSLGGRLCYLGIEEAYDNILAGNLKKVRTFNGLGVKEGIDLSDGNLSNIHNLEVKFADKTCNYIVNDDVVSDVLIGKQYNSFHIGTDIKVPCTNQIDGWPMKQHDLYSIIDYLLKLESPADNHTAAPSIPQKTSVDFLIGDWSTTEGVSMSFYADGYFELRWNIGNTQPEKGRWYAKAISDDTYFIEFVESEGLQNLSGINTLYSIGDANSHYEIVKYNENRFDLVHVHGNYTAKSASWRMPFARD